MVDHMDAQGQPVKIQAPIDGSVESADAALKADATSGADMASARIQQEVEEHVAEFMAQTGMSPRACYRLVLCSLGLKIIGGSWTFMAMLEYTRYYVINSVSLMTTVETATRSPQAAMKVFIFPFWGIAADRSSRKQVLVAAAVAACLSSWLLTIAPSIGAFIFTRMLSLISDISGAINNALLRDLFAPSEWERIKGGATGIKSRIAVFGTVVSGIAVAIGMAIMQLGDMGVTGFPNEFTQVKDLLPPHGCKGELRCVPPGQYSRGAWWRVDGCLRLLMLLGSIVLTIDMLVTVFLLPETLPQKYKTEGSLMTFTRRNWRKLFTPWNNLRVFATSQLQAFMSIRFLRYVIGSGGTVIFMTWYRRHEVDTLSIYALGTVTGVTGFLVLFLVPHIVDRHGDLRGLWAPALVLIMVQGLFVALLPPALWMASFVVFPLIAGPGGALEGFTPELMAKLIPPDVQGTFQTAKSFLYDSQQAVMVWPWLALLLVSEDWPHPTDALPIWVALLLGSVCLGLTLRQFRNDPRRVILEGRALEAYWQTDYVKGKPSWYRRHGGRLEPDSALESNTKGSLHNKVIAAEGASKVGLILSSEKDEALPTFLHFLTKELPKARSLSVVLHFLDGEDVLGHAWGTPTVSRSTSRHQLKADQLPEIWDTKCVDQEGNLGDVHKLQAGVGQEVDTPTSSDTVMSI